MTRNCDVDCVLSDWSGWGTCSEQTTGQMERTRAVLHEARNDGEACGDLSQTKICPVDCRLADWAEWSECDTDLGVKVRHRAIITQPMNDGRLCGLTQESDDCGQQGCVFGNWTKWGNCNTQTGTMTRTRNLISSDGGANCRTNDEAPCPVSCQVSQYGAWGACDRQNDLKVRTRSIIVAPQNGGEQCPLLEHQDTCVVDCRMSALQPLSWEEADCDPETGTKSRTRFVIEHPSEGGTPCPLATLSMSCEVDCVLHQWGDWGECNKNTGMAQRQRAVKFADRNGGTPCGDLTQNEDCMVHCEASEWSTWSPSPIKCDPATGTRSRSRSVIIQAKCGAQGCGDPCTLDDVVVCPVDCQESHWAAWSSCDQSKDVQRRTRTIEVQPLNGGAACGDMEEQRPCTLPTDAPTQPPFQMPTPAPNAEIAGIWVAEYFYHVELTMTIRNVNSVMLEGIVRLVLARQVNLAEDFVKLQEQPTTVPDERQFKVELETPDVKKGQDVLGVMLTRQQNPGRLEDMVTQELAKQAMAVDASLEIIVGGPPQLMAIIDTVSESQIPTESSSGEQYTNRLSAQVFLKPIDMTQFTTNARRIFVHSLSVHLQIEPRSIVLPRLMSGMFCDIHVRVTRQEAEEVAYRFQMLASDPNPDFGDRVREEYRLAGSPLPLPIIQVLPSPKTQGIQTESVRSESEERTIGTGVDTTSGEVRAEKAQSPAEKMRAQLVYVAGVFLALAMIIFIIAVVVRYRKRRKEKNAFFDELEAEYEEGNLLDDDDWATLGDFGDDAFQEMNPMFGGGGGGSGFDNKPFGGDFGGDNEIAS